VTMRMFRLLPAGLLGLGAALLVSCGSSGLIPAPNAEPLQSDFQEVAQAAQQGNGDCTATEAAIRKTENDFQALPATVNAGLHGRLAEGIANLSARARTLCTQPLAQATTTTSQSTTTTKTAPTTSTQTTPTTSTSTTPTTSTGATPTTSVPSGPGGGTPAPGAGGNESQSGTGGSGNGQGGSSGAPGTGEGGQAGGTGGSGAGGGNGQGAGQ
jgi:hypothetical protein